MKGKTAERARAYRPRDPDLDLVLDAIDGIPSKEVAEASGKVGNGTMVGRTTIDNWRNGKVKQPCHYTLKAALKAVGKRWAIVEAAPIATAGRRKRSGVVRRADQPLAN